MKDTNLTTKKKASNHWFEMDLAAPTPPHLTLGAARRMFMPTTVHAAAICRCGVVAFAALPTAVKRTHTCQ